MKKITGINPVYKVLDELDQDVLDASEEFAEGQITYDELKTLIGVEAAAIISEHQSKYDPNRYFDDPESL